MFRLLLADDEDLVRRGLVALIEREAPEVTIVGAAVDGEDALALAERTNPDVLLTDIRMPGLTGLELLSRLRAGHPDLRCIILSGYDEFDYARRAVSLGVAEYLLKPVDPDELLALLLRLDGELDTRRRDRERHLATLAITRDQHLRHLLEGVPVVPADLAASLPEAPAWGLILLQNAAAPADQQSLRAACEAAGPGTLVVDDAYGYLCAVFPLSAMDQAAAAEAAGKVHRALKEQGSDCMLAVARPAPDLAGLGAAHAEAVETAEYHAIGAPGESLLSWELTTRPIERWPMLPGGRRDALLDAVTLGTEEDAEREARSFMAYARDHVPPGALRALWFEIVVLLVNRAQQQGVRADALLEPRQDLRALLAGPAGGQEAQLVSLAMHAARECTRLRKQYSPRATVQEVKDYVAAHLAGDLTIRALARLVHLNAKYLGELFKQRTGESLGDYVIRARMNQACELLTTSTLKVYAIAEQVGYGDPKHFATMFRPLHGVTPAEYRERHRQQTPAGEGVS